jgi:hypothetical protein
VINTKTVSIENSQCDNSKKNILAFYNSVKNGPVTAAENQDAFFGRDHRRIQEWMVLGASVECMKENGWDYPDTAIETKPPAPDFRTFDHVGKQWQDIEITEGLPSGYNRDSFYRNIKSGYRFQSISECSESPDSCLKILRSAIIAKSLKPYADGSSLIVHLTFRLYRQRGKQYPPLSEVLHKHRLTEVAESPFLHIYVLACGMRELIILK